MAFMTVGAGSLDLDSGLLQGLPGRAVSGQNEAQQEVSRVHAAMG